MRYKQTDPHKKFIERGPYVILPIFGDVISELRIGTQSLTTLHFRGSSGVGSQLELREAVTLVRGDVEIYLEGTRPNSTCHPSTLAPLFDLLRTTVLDARASRNGVLEIEFSNKWLLRITPESGNEAWRFQYPAPDQIVSGHEDDVIMLINDDERLI